MPFPDLASGPEVGITYDGIARTFTLSESGICLVTVGLYIDILDSIFGVLLNAGIVSGGLISVGSNGTDPITQLTTLTLLISGSVGSTIAVQNLSGFSVDFADGNDPTIPAFISIVKVAD